MAFGMSGVYQRAGGIGNERERLFIETTSLDDLKNNANQSC